MKLSVVITGATGMVGEGVLQACLQHPDIDRILVINRTPGGVVHPKLNEVLHTDFFTLSALEPELTGYDACFFCLGVSSVGMKESDYYRLTYTLTLQMAQTLLSRNPAMTFCYVSGAGTDSTEAGKSMWARVKGKTENALLALPFHGAYLFRPGYLQPGKGLKRTKQYYTILSWLYPVWRTLFANYVCTLQELGQAMINAARTGYDKPVLEVNDIVRLAKA